MRLCWYLSGKKQPVIMKWKPVQQLMSMKSSSEVLQGLYSVHTMHSTYNWFRVQQGGGVGVKPLTLSTHPTTNSPTPSKIFCEMKVSNIYLFWRKDCSIVVSSVGHSFVRDMKIIMTNCDDWFSLALQHFMCKLNALCLNFHSSKFSSIDKTRML
jgi:hypothetical protein